MSSYFNDKEIEWRKQKWQTFSASEAHKLMVPGTKGDTFGAGAMTYIRRIARETCTLYNEEDRGFKSIAMQSGTAKEPESFFHLKKLLGFDGLQYCGSGEPVFKYLNDDFGCSPDLIAPLPDGTVSFGGELKNPTGDTHFDYLIGDGQIKDQWDLKIKNPAYYAQVQTSLLCYKCDLWLWVSHNEYFPFKDRMLIVEVKRDSKFLDAFEVRLQMAIKIKNQLVEQLKNRQ